MMDGKMKILFIIRGKDFWNPLGLMQIASIVKKHHEVKLINQEDNVIEEINRIKPDIIAYSSSSYDYDVYLKINKEVKEKFPKIFTVMGGSHPTFFPEVLNEGTLDAICVGEGDTAFEELLDCLENKKDISALNNIIVKGGKLNGLNPLVQDLDKLPFPDKKLFYSNKNIPTMNFITSRGCPYNCSYCFNHAFKKMYPKQKYIRKRSVDNILQEISEAKKEFDLKFVRFVDDIFIMQNNMDWLYEFCRKYPKEINLPFIIFARFDTMTKEIARLLNKTGCTTVLMSIESPNPKIRKEILNRNMTDEQIEQGTKYSKEEGLNVIAYTMLGLPTSTLKDDINAVDFAIKIGIDFSEYLIFQPMPKTELNDVCVNNKLVDKINDKGGFYNASTLSCFSDKEKNIQRNIVALGSLAVRYPFLRNIIMNHLIYLPYNKLFNMTYATNKFLSYTYGVYKVKYTFIERLRLLKNTIKLEKWRWKT